MNKEDICFFTEPDAMKDPFKAYFFYIIDLVHEKIREGYTQGIFNQKNHSTGEIITMIMANCFSNLCNHYLNPMETTSRIKAFEDTLKNLNHQSSQLFLALQTATAPENVKN